MFILRHITGYSPKRFVMFLFAAALILRLGIVVAVGQLNAIDQYSRLSSVKILPRATVFRFTGRTFPSMRSDGI
jgi:hypothetical protein